MPYPHDLYAPTNPSQPREVGICDRCSRKVYHSDLAWQFEYRGNSLHNLQLLVCDWCLDTPADQLRPVYITGPEGVVKNPRFIDYAAAAAGGTTPPTQDDLNEIFEDQIPP